MADVHRFLQDVRDHRMAIEHDNGVFRSVLFTRPSSSVYHFRLVTWPGSLAISGDCGSYTFTRTHDMFRFFRNSEDGSSAPLRINPDYWAQKLEAVDRAGGKDDFDQAAFAEHVVRNFREARFDGFRPGAKMQVWRDVREDLLSVDFSTPSEAISAALEFTVPDYLREPAYGVRGSWSPFEEAWDWNVSKRSFRLLWCMWAIVWGIKRYDQHIAGRNQAAHDRAVLRGAA